jgi:hypothetical protein
MSRPGAAELLEPGAGLTAHLGLQHRGPAERQPHRSEGLPGPGVERERIGVAGDQTVVEPERGVNVIVDPVAGGAKRVVGHPVGASGLIVGLVLEEFHLEVLGAAGEHPPHRPGLVTFQVVEDRIGKASVRCVAGGHRGPVEASEGAVETLNQLCVGMSHEPTLPVASGHAANTRIRAIEELPRAIPLTLCPARWT